MNKVKLSNSAKNVMRILYSGKDRPSTFPEYEFAAGAEELEEHGFAVCAWGEGHQLEDAILTSKGETYIIFNPSLRNPIDWKYVFQISLLLISTVASIIALFVACSKI